MGSFYFAGFSVSSAFVPNLADRLGRKKPYFISILTQSLAYALIFFSRDVLMVNFCYFVVGLCAGGRVAIGTTYMNEFLPERWRNLATSIMNCFDASITIWQAFYYMVNPDWKPLHAYGLVFAILMMLVLMTIPESPRYLYAKGRFDETRQVLKDMALSNGEATGFSEGIVFDTELVEGEVISTSCDN